MPAEMIDTNILIYSLDESEPEKMRIAKQHLRRVAMEGNGCTSTQVLAEFAVNAKRKCKPSLSTSEIVSQINKIGSFLKVYPVRQEHIIAAAEVIERRSLSFWDALVWSVAKDHSVSIIMTEDGPSGTSVEGILFNNPFINQ
jgi:predicted nucleic acid-binding protein